MIIRCPRCGATAAAEFDGNLDAGARLPRSARVITGKTVSMSCIDRESSVCEALTVQAKALAPNAKTEPQREIALVPGMVPAV